MADEPKRDPRLIAGLLEHAIAAERRGDERALARATADMLRNADSVQHYFLVQGLGRSDDMRTIRDTMRAANRINADLPPDQRMTPAPQPKKTPSKSAKTAARLDGLERGADPQSDKSSAPRRTPPRRRDAPGI